MKEKIFKKIKINGVTLKNRFVVSPMCQYSSSNGSPVSWHYKHLTNLRKFWSRIVNDRSNGR